MTREARVRRGRMRAGGVGRWVGLVVERHRETARGRVGVGEGRVERGRIIRVMGGRGRLNEWCSWGWGVGRSSGGWDAVAR